MRLCRSSGLIYYICKLWWVNKGREGSSHGLCGQESTFLYPHCWIVFLCLWTGFGFFLWMSIFYINVAVQSGLMKLMLLSKDQKVQEAISKEEVECLFLSSSHCQCSFHWCKRAFWCCSHSHDVFEVGAWLMAERARLWPMLNRKLWTSWRPYSLFLIMLPQAYFEQLGQHPN